MRLEEGQMLPSGAGLAGPVTESVTDFVPPPLGSLQKNYCQGPPHPYYTTAPNNIRLAVVG